MSFFSQRGWSILLQTVSGAGYSVFLFLSSFAHAIVDTNSNGVSDLWERRFNTGSLFTGFDPAADPDGDGWTNLQEAAAGTDPRDANPPVGFIQPETERIPAVYNTPEEEGGEPTLATPEALHVFWPTLPGKNYSLFVSVDLGPQNWLPVGPPRIGSGSVLGALAPLTQADGNLADKSFWRVAVTDVDSDSDTVTDAEEHQLGTNPNHSDTDGDGLPDGWEIANGIDPKDGGSLNSGNGPAGDPDFDGLSNLLEWQHGGSSRLKDTDGDGMDDGPEFHAGLIITDRDENDNGSTDGYEDFDGDGYANREEAVAGTDPRNGAILPDGISNPSNPILLLRDPSQTSPNLLNRTESVETNLSRSSSFNYRIVDGGQRYAEFHKPGFLEFESGIVEPAEIGASAGKTLQDYPAYYLTSTTSDLAEHAYRIQFYTDGEPDHLFSGSRDGNRTMIETTLKENGEYHYDMTQSGTIHYEDFIDGELSDEETLTFGVDSEASWPGLSDWNYHGLEVRSPVQTHEVWDYDYSIAYNPNGGSGPNTGHASKVVNLSSEYADPMLVSDLTSALSAVSYSDPSAGAASSASFLWENDHSAANMQDSKYRIETNGLPPGVLPNAKVVFFWKEVFESHDQKERITTWRSESAAPVGGGASTTSNHELLHPAKPGTISVSPSEAALDAPASLRALNPGELGLLESDETAADGQTHTRFTPASSEAVRFQVGLDEQTAAPTLRASGAGSALLWQKVKDGPWQSHPLPYAIPAEQAAGAASEPGQYCLQGTQPGELTLELVVGGSVMASQTVQIVSVDLDVDSDNAAGLNASTDEEQIESDNTRSGTIIVINPSTPTGMNGMPLSAEGLVALQLRTDQLESGDTISILYAPALMTIWNSGPGVLPTATQRIVPGQPYTLASLGLLPGQTKPLAIQAISTIGGLSAITMQMSMGDVSNDDTVLVSLLPVEFEYFKPDTNSDQQWQDPSNKMAWSSLYTFDAPKNESLKFKVTAGGVTLTPAILDLIEIEVARHAGDPAYPPTWAKYKLSEIGRISADKKEAWCTISAADMISKVKIPAVGSAIRNASMDWIADLAISSFSDSNFVDGWWKPRPDGYSLVNAKGVGNSSATTVKDPSGEDILAYKAKSNREYLISGGSMYTALRLAGGSGETRALCHETTDWLYLSVHGWHSANGSYPSGCIETVDGNGAGQHEFVIPGDVNWSGMKFVIIAGCSVLDINDYNEFYSGGDHTDSPGKRWEATGPELLLGYNMGGPSDKNGGKIIIDRFYGSNPVSANNDARIIEWMGANRDEKAWNACAIKKNDYYAFFKYTKIYNPLNRTGFSVYNPKWTKIQKSDW